MRQLADTVGISNPYLSQIENGLRAPSKTVVDAIARSLHLPPDELLEAAGLADEPEESAVIDAIRADSRLTAHQRSVLIDVYEALRAQGPAPRRARRSQSR
jgi:transcriptional regulator with XRE-family HTH domain